MCSDVSWETDEYLRMGPFYSIVLIKLFSLDTCLHEWCISILNFGHIIGKVIFKTSSNTNKEKFFLQNILLENAKGLERKLFLARLLSLHDTRITEEMIMNSLSENGYVI